MFEIPGKYSILMKIMRYKILNCFRDFLDNY